MTEGTAQDNFCAMEYSEFYNNIKNLTSELKSMKSLCTERHKIDINSEIARQEKKLGKLTGEKNSLEGRMKNEKFVANAPQELIAQTKDRIVEIEAQEVIIKNLIESLR